jgi:hypothetical protein
MPMTGCYRPPLKRWSGLTPKAKTPVTSLADWYKADEGKPLEAMNCSDYNQEAVRGKIQHAVSVLVETEAVRKVGGFDESLPTWEDWDFFIQTGC